MVLIGLGLPGEFWGNIMNFQIFILSLPFFNYLTESTIIKHLKHNNSHSCCSKTTSNQSFSSRGVVWDILKDEIDSYGSAMSFLPLSSSRQNSKFWPAVTPHSTHPSSWFFANMVKSDSFHHKNMLKVRWVPHRIKICIFIFSMDLDFFDKISKVCLYIFW